MGYCSFSGRFRQKFRVTFAKHFYGSEVENSPINMDVLWSRRKVWSKSVNMAKFLCPFYSVKNHVFVVDSSILNYDFCPLPCGGLTLYVFLPRSCCAYPTWLGRRGTLRNNTIPSCRGPVPRAVRLILSGIPPLSDDRPPCSGIRERGIYPRYVPDMYLIYL